MLFNAMRSARASRHHVFVLAVLMAAASVTGMVAAGEPAPAAQKLDIGFRTTPDPPRSGQNTVEVSLKLADGSPVNDAQVTVVYFMPAMPAMNMPEMKTSIALVPAGKGTYRGGGSLVMAGTWTVTVTATRAGKPLGTRKLSVIAR
jgi:nitrogen fixation protein FixH